MSGYSPRLTSPTLRGMPIRRKLLIITLFTTAAALLLSAGGIIASDSFLFRGYLQRDLSALAHIIGDNSTAALAFDDPAAAAETLSALRARPHVIAACIFRANGTLLARYASTGTASACPAPAPRDFTRFTSDNLIVSRAIVLRERGLGNVVIVYDLGEISERVMLFGGTVFAVLLAASLVAFLISSHLRDLIAVPISRLVETATAVSETRDYSIRAPKMTADELGVLVDGFNEMLAGIQSRDDSLRQALLRREEALRDAQNARESLETTLASIGDAVISTDVEGRIVLANRAARALLRWSGDEIIGKPLDDVFRIVNEFTREKLESPVAKVLREGAVVGLANHTVLIAKDNSEVPIADSGAPIRDESGNVHGTVLVFRDVTARRRADATSRLLASIVESSDDAIIGMDLNGAFTSWNQGAERIFGYTAAEALGNNGSSLLVVPGQQDEMPQVLARIRNGERVEQYQARRRTRSGAILDVAVTVSPVHDALGRINGASKIARDITEQVRATERLAQLNVDLLRTNERLARSNEDLERFAFIASHDLQEPLRMIAIYSQLLVKTAPGALDAQAEAYVENIVDGTKRMRQLLADLLAYAEVGVRPEEPLRPVDLNAVLDKARQNLQAAIDDSGAIIISDRLPVLDANEGHFVPLFQNLIGNAIKYRSQETPRIQISVGRSDGDLRFAVSDNGIGIEPEYHEKIFVAFKRLHGKQIPGTGIGLAICQRIVQRYGGRIWVESRAGQGATFIFTLPVELSHKEDSDGRARSQTQT